MQLTPNITYTRETPPATEPISLQEAKLFLRVEHETEDQAIQQMITAARDVAEQILNRSLLPQSWLAMVHGAVPSCIALAYGPVTQIQSIIYDDAGASHVVATDAYRLDDKHNLSLLSVPSTMKLEVRYEAAVAATAAELPASLKQNMLQHVAYLYGFRSLDEAQRIQDITRLYAPFREVKL